MSLYTILIIDDHPLFRKGVAQLVESVENFRLVGEATSGREGLAMVQALRPDLVLLDLNMKEMNGIATLERIKKLDHDPLVVMLTVSDAENDLVAALRAGADGYLLKDMEPEDLMAKLELAAKGQVVLDQTLTGLLAHALRNDKLTPAAGSVNLTDREHEILTLIAAGMSNKLIARELGISDGTVKVHVKHLLRKLNLKSRLEAAVWAHEKGLNN